MREIEFRAWNKTVKYMVSWASVKRNFRQYLGEPSNSNSNFIANNGTDEWELMQYTGLIDRNGEKIFEGDILKMGTGHIGEIFHSCLGFRFGRDANGFRWWEWAKGEVVGNIFETPELMK